MAEGRKGRMKPDKGEAEKDFLKGPVWKIILSQAVPLTIAQVVSLLYSVVDRIYLGHLGHGNSLALTGVGLTFPIVTLIMGVAALFGLGGVPLFSMARGAGNNEKAARVMGNSFALLLISAGILAILGYLFCRPVLFAFGASPDSYLYAGRYLRVYLAGTFFFMITAGMNGYISAQGFPRTGMLSIIIGAVINIILDPIFIFVLRMGVTGAALATVISQGVSAVWVLRFLTGKKSVVPLSAANMKLQRPVVLDIVRLGTSNFIMQGTNCAVQVACNTTLQIYGGDLFVGIMTVANSIREIFMLPISGMVSGALPVISFNYGAKALDRVKSGIRFNTLAGAAYTLTAWLIVFLFPGIWFRIFSDDVQMMDAGVGMLKIYFFGFVFMSLQFAGQSTFQALGDARHAVFFSLLRKAFIVVPLTLLLPAVGFGVKGVFLAEPVSNVIGGTACYLTMRRTVYRRIKENIQKE